MTDPTTTPSPDRAARIAALSPARRRLLEQRLGIATPASADAPSRLGRQSAPLSHAQQRLWFLDQLRDDGRAYHMLSAIRFRGPLDRVALDRALQTVAARHEILRTRIVQNADTALQVVDARARIVLRTDRLQPGSNVGRGLLETLRRKYDAPFDLAQAPLLRATLLELDSDDHVLITVAHQIISDGLSEGVFNHELASLYAAHRDGRSDPLPPLPVQYSDYAIWERQRLAGVELDRLVVYWTAALAGAPPLLALPTDRSRGHEPDGRSGWASLRLSNETLARLRDLCQRRGVTPYMALLAAFAVLLGRLSGQDDLVVGTPVAGRDRVELERLMGLFVHTVALRLRLSGNPTFEALLDRVRTTTLGAFEHQHLPFERIVEELRVPRASYSPVFQVFFNMIEAPVPPVFAGLEAGWLDSGDGLASWQPEAKFDLTLYVVTAPDSLEFRASYCADLFDASTVDRLLRQLHGLIDQVVRDPSRPIGGCSLRPEPDAHVLPDPTAPLPAESQIAIHQGFAVQARRHRERVAVVAGDGTWTYGELAAMSARLARRLRRDGVLSGDVVAVHASPSASLVWCVLGILEAGATVLILDAAYPAARLLRYLATARPVGLLCLPAAGPLAGPMEAYALEAGLRCRIDVPAGSANQLAAFLADVEPADTSEPVRVTGDDPAYVVFTSGSTGEPVGVRSTHGAVSHFLRWHIDTFGFTESDRFSQLSGLAYDPLLRDIFTPLWVGATLHIPPFRARDLAGELAAWVSRERITACHVTPALAEALAASAGDGCALGELRWLFTGGDRLTYGLTQRLRRAGATACRVVNVYGTTETPQVMAFHVVDAGAGADRAASDDVPIGRGIDGVQLLLVNEAGQLAGIGELAEIWVRTPYLSQGYIGVSRDTEDRFGANPFTGSPGDRVYRTGDLGRYLPDGSVVCAGRRDHQISLRGVRIEPAEIEAAIRDYPGIRDCVVVPSPDRLGETRLLAYVATDAVSVDGPSLRTHLADHLPAPMIPAAFVALAALPLTPNGKVDRAALPAPAEERGAAGGGGLPPRDAIENAIAAIWREVLGLDHVGVHDHFFDIGGHSLLAVAVAARLRHRHGVEVSVREVFDHPTLASFAARFEIDALAAEAGTLRFSVRPQAARPSVGERRVPRG